VENSLVPGKGDGNDGTYPQQSTEEADKAQARPADEQRKRMSARKRVLVGSASVLAIGGAGAVLAPATPASAVVLVNYDGGTRVTFYTKVK
jgi:hypothetical protein